MGIGARIIGSALLRWGERFDKMLVANLIAAVLSLPLLFVCGFVALRTGQLFLGAAVTTTFVGILPNPATAGLQFMAREMATEELLLMPGPFEGLQQYWKDALRVWLVSVFITVLLGFNVLFYANLHVSFAPLAEIIAAYALLIWLAAHVYVYPLILEQEDRRTRIVYRNAFIMAMSRPLVTMQVFIVWVFFLIVTSASGLVVAVGLSIAAGLQQQATVSLLPSFRREQTESQHTESA